MPVQGCSTQCPLQEIELKLEPLPFEPSCESINQADIAKALYEPLEDWQIRVLSLRPGRFGEPLISTLLTVDMLYDSGVLIHRTKQKITYNALSYCWGDGEACRPLLCNGRTYPITRSAYRALQRLRKTHEVVNVWIHAICINQHNIEEKPHQVGRMLSVYEKAEQVTIWLGEPAEGGSLVAQLLWESDTSTPTSPSGRQKLDLTQRLHHLAWDDRPDAGSNSTLCQAHAEAFLSGIAEITGCPWFDRVWIRQEIWAAQKVTVHIGRYDFSWNVLKDIEGHLSVFQNLLLPQFAELFDVQALQRRTDSLIVASPVQHVRAQSRDRPNASFSDDDANSLDIVNVLRKAEGSQCSIAHDHIYGLLGMTSMDVSNTGDVNETSNRLTVSYEQSASETFQALARYIISRDESLNVLRLARPHEGVLSDLGLPSWTPDWRRFSHLIHGFFSTSHSAVCASLTPRPDILDVEGYKLGTLDEVPMDDNVVRRRYTLSYGAHQTDMLSLLRQIYQPPGHSRFSIQLPQDWGLSEPGDWVVRLYGLDGWALIRPIRAEPSLCRYIGCFHRDSPDVPNQRQFWFQEDDAIVTERNGVILVDTKKLQYRDFALV